MSAELVLAPIGCFVTVALLLIGLLSPRQTVRDQIEPYVGSRVAGRELAQPSWQRALRLVSKVSLGLYERLTPVSALDTLRRKLETAGDPISRGGFLACRALGLFLIPGAYGALLVSTGTPITLGQVLFLAFLGYGGSYAPKAWLASRISARRRAIDRALPDALDLIVVSMEAGLALDAALAKVAEKSDGPLADELGKTLNEIVLGTPRREALRRMATRASVPALTALTNSIVQADEMGVSMADVMRTQAEDARVRRRQRAEELAHKAGIKMLFPLICFILPSVLIVAIGPAALIIIRQFSSGTLGG